MDGMLSWLFLENNYMMKFIKTLLPSVDVDGGTLRPRKFKMGVQFIALISGRSRALA